MVITNKSQTQAQTQDGVLCSGINLRLRGVIIKILRSFSCSGLSTKLRNPEYASYLTQGRRTSKTTMAAHIRNIRRDLREGRLRRPRLFQDRSNPLEVLSEDEVIERYRFRPCSIMFIIGLIDVATVTARSFALPPLLKLLVCLRFLATSSLHLVMADTVHISRQTAGRCIRDVANKIAGLRAQFIRFPRGEDAVKTKRDFAKITGK